MRVFLFVILSFLFANVNISITNVSYEDSYIEISIESNEDIIGFQFQIEASPNLGAVFSVEELNLENLEFFNQELTGYNSDYCASIMSVTAACGEEFTLFGNDSGLVVGFGLNDVSIATIDDNLPSQYFVSDGLIRLVRIPWTFDFDQSGTVGIGSDARFIKPGGDGLPPQYIETTFTQEYPLSNEGINLPEDYVLNKAFPNPFNPVTNISYGIPCNSDIILAIYDINGRHIKTLENSFKSAGFYSIDWDANDKNGNQVSTGLYIYQLIAGNHILSEKVSLIK
jgi:hypothetical protein